MELTATPLAGAFIVEPKLWKDERGSFFESWNARDFEAAGIPASFVQENQSKSAKGVLRGLHFQNPNPQAKLVRVVSGAVHDVIVDLRRSSATFGHWFAVELSSENRRMLWVPEGFAHGFLSLTDEAELFYKCTEYYSPSDEWTLAWDDPDIAIEWPLERAPILSGRDANGCPFDRIAAFP